MKLNLKLGESPSESAIAIPSSPGEKEQDVYYPEFTFREKGEPEFPEEGVMKIRYRKVRTSIDKKSKKPYSCTLEVREIISAEGNKKDSDDSPTKKFDEAGDALDKLRDEKIKSNKSDDSDY